MKTTQDMIIKTERTAPPCPIKDFNYDWCAWVDGQEEHKQYGWGRTEDEAIENLKWLLEDE